MSALVKVNLPTRVLTSSLHPASLVPQVMGLPRLSAHPPSACPRPRTRRIHRTAVASGRQLQRRVFPGLSHRTGLRPMLQLHPPTHPTHRHLYRLSTASPLLSISLPRPSWHTTVLLNLPAARWGAPHREATPRHPRALTRVARTSLVPSTWTTSFNDCWTLVTRAKSTNRYVSRTPRL